MARILLITTKQPSSNPRMRKSADALAQLGHTIHVLYAYNAEWADEADIPILQNAKWTYERIGGHPTEERTTYLIGRILRKAHEFLGSPKRALCRGYYKYIQKGIRWQPDLVIGHNPGALGPLDVISRRLQIPALFDAEDFHRGETNPDSKAAKTVQQLEDEVLPHLKTITAASPLIATTYEQIYPHLKAYAVNNAFPIQRLHSVSNDLPKGPLSLVWFSQVVGLDRGLGEFLKSLHFLEDVPLRVGILGLRSADMETKLKTFVTSDSHSLEFQNPMPEEELFHYLSHFELGLAFELTTPENRNLCRTNKLYTYPLAGCYMLLSKTAAQEQFINEFPELGRLIDISKQEASIAQMVRYYHEHRGELKSKRIQAQKVAQTSLHWEHESKHLASVVAEMLKP